MFFLICILGEEIDYQKLVDEINNDPNSSWEARVPDVIYKPIPLNLLNEIKHELKKLRKQQGASRENIDLSKYP